MTGAGKASAHYQGRTITVFIKSINSKQLDANLRIPSCYREREIELRSLLGEHLLRGKVDLVISIDEGPSAATGVQQIDREAFLSYARELEVLHNTLGISTPIDTAALLRLPGVLLSGEARVEEPVSAEEWEWVRTTALEAIGALQEHRAREGQMLSEVCRQRIGQISELLSQVDKPEHERVPQIRERIEESLKKLSIDAINMGRLEQELIYYIEKLDVNEEKDRLRHHLAYFIEVMEGEAGQGKKLGFIAQEIGREINTLGSKSNSAQMQQLVVRMKDELEQIKEQSLNIL